MNGNALLSCGCEKETLNPHEDINKNESIEGGWGAGCSPPAYTLDGHEETPILKLMGGYNGR